MDVIEVLEGGIFTTAQDLGRYGYQRYGVPVSGAMDPFALRVANILVGNPEEDAGLEVTLAGAQMRFLVDTIVAVTGADLGPRLDDAGLPMWQAVAVPEGGVLAFAQIGDGMRAYLAVAGGIDLPQVLGSRSTYTRSRLGGVEGRVLAPGDTLPTSWQEPSGRVEGKRLGADQIPSYGHSHALRVVLGPQDDAFTAEGIQALLSSTYTVTPTSDRIGSRLEGPPIRHKEDADIISDGTPFGAVQVTGDGMPIVLMADRGTTGGYTKIATVISVDLPGLAQAVPGDTVTFRSVSVEEAHQALTEQEARLKSLRSAPPVVFARHTYRVKVGDADHNVVTGLKELSAPSPRPRPVPLRMTVQAPGGGETQALVVEVKSGPGE